MNDSLTLLVLRCAESGRSNRACSLHIKDICSMWYALDAMSERPSDERAPLRYPGYRTICMVSRSCDEK